VRLPLTCHHVRPLRLGRTRTCRSERTSLTLSPPPPPTSRSRSILYQRGVYPPEDFKQVKKYGLTLFTSADEALERYIQNLMKQVNSASEVLSHSCEP